MIKKFIKYIVLKFKYRNKNVFLSFSDSISFTSFFEGANRIQKNTLFSGRIGFGSYIGNNCQMQNVEIGRFTSIGSNVLVLTGSHPYTYPYVSTSPLFYSNRGQLGIVWEHDTKFNEIRKVENTNISVKIGNDCWIGVNVLIVGGCVIHDGAVILSGAVVTKDVPPYAIVGGVPAEIRKYRFNKEDIDFLLRLKWWNKELGWIRKNRELLLNLNYLKSHSGEFL